MITLVRLLPYSTRWLGVRKPRKWLPSFPYCKKHVIIAAADAGVNYQIKIIVHKGVGTDYNDNTADPPVGHVYCNNHCRDDFGDVRFTKKNKKTQLSYWLESYVSGDQAIFWVKIEDDLSVNVTIYIFYGNSSVTTTSNGDNTFILFDDFTSDRGWTYSVQGDYGAVRSSFGSGNYTSAVNSVRIGISSYTPGFVGDYGRISKNVTFDGTQVKVEISWRDDVSTTAAKLFHYKQIIVAGSTIYDVDCADDETAFISISVATTPPTGLQEVIFQIYCKQVFSNYAMRSYLDDIKIRKYVSPEPTHGDWGNEEH